MVLAARFHKAEDILSKLDYSELLGLKKTCSQIQAAQRAILERGVSYMNHCAVVCRGLCCRNMKVMEIISLYDFILLLVMAPEFKYKIAKQVRLARVLHTADCVFLENGRGPCLFPVDLKPERCIASFCFETQLIRRDLIRLRTSFNRLIFSLRWYRWRRFGLVLLKKIGLIRAAAG